MNTLNDAMKDMLAKQLPILATVNPDNTPNIGPKRSLRVFDDNTLIYNENTGGQTLKNVENGSKLAVAIIDREALDGYRFYGSGKTYTAGEAYENAVAFAKENNMGTPKCAVLINIEQIFSLRSGPMAGTKIEK